MHRFGSALRADFDPNRSDLEHQLLEITGRPVDLVMADAVRNRYVRADMEAKKQLIDQAKP